MLDKPDSHTHMLFLNKKPHGQQTSDQLTSQFQLPLLTQPVETLNTAQIDQKDKLFKTVSPELSHSHKQDTTASQTSIQVKLDSHPHMLLFKMRSHGQQTSNQLTSQFQLDPLTQPVETSSTAQTTQKDKLSRTVLQELSHSQLQDTTAFQTSIQVKPDSHLHTIDRLCD